LYVVVVVVVVSDVFAMLYTYLPAKDFFTIVSTSSLASRAYESGSVPCLRVLDGLCDGARLPTTTTEVKKQNKKANYRNQN
jgi:hypothetical protein